MDTKFFVGVRWEPAVHPPRCPDQARVLAAGPSLPPVVATLERSSLMSRCSYGRGFADEHLVAEAAGDGPWPRVADVLIVREAFARRGGAIRGRFPGRLVALFLAPGRTPFVEVATGWGAWLVPFAEGGGDALWPYASFVHAWTAAGRPLDALHGAELTDGSPGGERGVRVSVVDRSTDWRAAA
jgi:hypothetical protein